MEAMSAAIERLLREAAVVQPPAGLPAVQGLHVDVSSLYKACGGAVLSAGDYAWRLVGPAEFVPANLAVLRQHPLGDRSDDWYVIAEQSGEPTWRLSLDMSQAHGGRCYDSFHETHGLRGDTPVVALTLAELVERLLDDGGRRPYWLREEFVGYGDAFDD
jgi:hypothetical protein